MRCIDLNPLYDLQTDPLSNDEVQGCMFRVGRLMTNASSCRDSASWDFQAICVREVFAELRQLPS